MIETYEAHGEDYYTPALNGMPYTKAFLYEVLRLEPPVPFLVKTVAEDCTLPDGSKLRAGMEIDILVSAINRDTSVWGPLALEFRPERWLAPDPRKWRPQDSMPAQRKLGTVNDFDLLTFNGGKRLCLGKQMAITNATIIFAHLVREFRFTLGPKKPGQLHDVERMLCPVDKLRYGLQVQVQYSSPRPGRKPVHRLKTTG